MNELLYIFVTFVLQAICFIFIARFLLQACRVDFYNPISQGLVRFTDPVLKPMRLVLPGYRNLDFAAFLAAVLVQILLILSVAQLTSSYVGGVGHIIGQALLSTILLVLWIVRWSIFIVIIASWIAPGNYHPALALLHQLCEPVLAPARKLIPPLGGLDLSPLAVILALLLLESALPQIYVSLTRFGA
jgi:YggT family protein